MTLACRQSSTRSFSTCVTSGQKDEAFLGDNICCLFPSVCIFRLGGAVLMATLRPDLTFGESDWFAIYRPTSLAAQLVCLFVSDLMLRVSAPLTSALRRSLHRCIIFGGLPRDQAAEPLPSFL